MKQPLVSIIIPTYNRAHLIGETLDSVLAQTYTNWECIVVDDGSTDNTAALLKTYCDKDARFKYVHRPDTHKPGGNGARNYGFELSKGEYIQWFDSDDLMLEDFLQVKMGVILSQKVDFVVTKSINFFNSNLIEIKKYKGNQIFPLTGEHYIHGNIYWLTLDFLVIKDVLQGIYFDERLLSGQETNFFLRLLTLRKINGKYIEKVVSKRRILDDSIQQKLQQEEVKAYKGKLISHLYAYFDIRQNINKNSNLLMQNQLIALFYKQGLKNLSKKYFYQFTKLILQERGFFKAFGFLLANAFHGLPRLGYKLFSYARK